MAAKPKNAKTDATAKKVRVKPTTAFAPLKFKDFTITQKKSGRYEVITTSTGKNVNGGDKEKLLLEAKILIPSIPKAKSEAATT